MMVHAGKDLRDIVKQFFKTIFMIFIKKKAKNKETYTPMRFDKFKEYSI